MGVHVYLHSLAQGWVVYTLTVRGMLLGLDRLMWENKVMSNQMGRTGPQLYVRKDLLHILVPSQGT